MWFIEELIEKFGYFVSKTFLPQVFKQVFSDILYSSIYFSKIFKKIKLFVSVKFANINYKSFINF